MAFARRMAFETFSKAIMEATTPPVLPTQELAQAMALFQQCLDAEYFNEYQPSAPQTVFTTWITVWMLIYQRLNQNATLVQAVGMFVDSMNELSTNKRVREKTLSVSTGAYSRARTRLHVAVAERAADHVFETLLSTTPRILDGRRVFVVDGTCIGLQSNAKLRAQWPSCPSAQGASVWPICSMAFAHELDTGMAVRPETGAMYGDHAESEVAIARRLLPRIPAKSVIIADRGFGVFDFVYYAQQAGHDVLTRLNEGRFQSMRRNAELVRPGVWKWQWTPTDANRKSHPELPADATVSVALHEFTGFSGQTLWIATTLELTTERVAACYARRAEIETDIRHWKKTLQADALSGQSVDMVLKELAMASIAYNLIVQIRYLAALHGNVAPKKFSFSGVWSLVLPMLLQRNDRTPEEWLEQLEFVLKKIQHRKLPNRPNRSYPRAQYSKKRSKFPVKTPPKDIVVKK